MARTFSTASLGVTGRTASDEECHPIMGIATGTVVAGKVVVEGMDVPEGSVVTRFTPEPDEQVCLTTEEEAELLEAIAEAG
jgi:hypothetical protein